MKKSIIKYFLRIITNQRFLAGTWIPCRMPMMAMALLALLLGLELRADDVSCYINVDSYTAINNTPVELPNGDFRIKYRVEVSVNQDINNVVGTLQGVPQGWINTIDGEINLGDMSPGTNYTDTFVVRMNTATPDTADFEWAFDGEVAQKNILVIVADDMGVDQMSAYAEHDDAPNTPSLDALAGNGVLFRNAWTNPNCAPSRAAILTGKHGYKTKVLYAGGDYSELAKTETTIADELDGSTYARGAFGKWGLGTKAKYQPQNQGFDYFAGSLYDTLKGGDGVGYESWKKSTWDGSTMSDPEVTNTYATEDTATEAADWIDAQVDANKPWFAYVAFSAPHSPFHVPKKLDDGTYPFDNSRYGLNDATDCYADGEDVTKNCYRASVEALDYWINELFTRMQNAGTDGKNVYDDTLIIFIGDNGTPDAVIIQEGGDTPFIAGHGKNTVYEGGANVPLIVSGGSNLNITNAGVLEGETDLVLGLDIFETVLEMAGIQSSQTDLDSVSLLPYLFTEETNPIPRDTVYTELYKESNGVVEVNKWAVSDGYLKYIFDADANPGHEEQCYDLVLDAGEETDLYDENDTGECDYLQVARPCAQTTPDTCESNDY